MNYIISISYILLTTVFLNSIHMLNILFNKFNHVYYLLYTEVFLFIDLNEVLSKMTRYFPYKFKKNHIYI